MLNQDEFQSLHTLRLKERVTWLQQAKNPNSGKKLS